MPPVDRSPAALSPTRCRGPRGRDPAGGDDPRSRINGPPQMERREVPEVTGGAFMLTHSASRVLLFANILVFHLIIPRMAVTEAAETRTLEDKPDDVTGSQ